MGRELNNQQIQITALPVLAKFAALEGRYPEARRLYRKTLALARERGAPIVDLWYRGELAVAELRLGNAGQARQDLCAVLRLAASKSMGTWPMVLLLPVAEYLASTGRPERAVEIHALAWRYPFIANSRWQQDVFGKRMAAVAASLPPEVVVAAEERGRALNLQTTVEELLEELERTTT